MPTMFLLFLPGPLLFISPPLLPPSRWWTCLAAAFLFVPSTSAGEDVKCFFSCSLTFYVTHSLSV